MRNRNAILMFVFALSAAGFLAVMGNKTYGWDITTVFWLVLILLLGFMYFVFRENYLNR